MISEMPLYVHYLHTDLLGTDAFDFICTPTAVIKEKEMFLPPQPLRFTTAVSVWARVSETHRISISSVKGKFSTTYGNCII